MIIKYKILSANPAENSIEVRYTTDILTESVLATYKNADLTPILQPDGSIQRCRSDVNITLPYPVPTGQALEDFILARAPSYWMETLERGMSTVDPTVTTLQSLVGAVFVPGTTAPPGGSGASATPETGTLEYAKAQKKSEIARWRYNMEIGGVLFNGATIRTDRESQAQLSGAFSSLKEGLITSVDWKTAEGVFTTLGLAEVTAIAAAVAQHVQSSFTAEKTYCAQVDACTTIEQVNAIVVSGY